jgi:hypothetical protein
MTLKENAMKKTLFAIVTIAATLNAANGIADDSLADGRPLLKTSIGAGFVPELYAGYESCTITDRAVVKVTESAFFSTKEVTPLTVRSLEKVFTAIEEARAAGLSDLGPAPLDAPLRVTEAFLADGTTVLLLGVENHRIVENQSMSGQGLAFILKKHCDLF